MSNALYLTLDREEACTTLRKLLTPGQNVFTVLSHRTASGMRRSIRVIINDPRCNEPYDVSWLVARATGRRGDKSNGGVICNGCGMDAGFDLIYSLGRALWPKGTDSDGGYALYQHWL